VTTCKRKQANIYLSAAADNNVRFILIVNVLFLLFFLPLVGVRVYPLHSTFDQWCAMRQFRAIERAPRRHDVDDDVLSQQQRHGHRSVATPPQPLLSGRPICSALPMLYGTTIVRPRMGRPSFRSGWSGRATTVRMRPVCRVVGCRYRVSANIHVPARLPICIIAYFCRCDRFLNGTRPSLSQSEFEINIRRRRHQSVNSNEPRLMLLSI